MKLKSMKQVMIGVIVSLMAVVVGITLLFTIIRTVEGQNSAIESAKLQLTGHAGEISGEIVSRLNFQMSVASLISKEMIANKTSGLTSRSRVDALLKNYLEMDKGFFGTYSVWEANEWDGQDSLFLNTPPSDATGRLLTYWNRASGTIKSEAVVAYNPSDAGSEWYQLPYSQKRSYLIDPFAYAVGGKNVLMVSGVVPIVLDGKSVGVSGVDMAMDFVQSELRAVQKELYEGKAELLLLSSNRTIAGATVADSLLGKLASKELLPSAEIESELEAKGFVVQLTAKEMVLWQKIPLPTDDKAWILSLSVPRSTILAPAVAMTRNSILMGLILIVASLVYAAFRARATTHRIVEPVAACVKAAHDAAEGNTEFGITDASIEELHDLVLSFRKMGNSLEKKVSIVESIAAGDLLVEPEVLSDKDRLGIALVDMVEQLGETLHRISVATIAVETGSGHLAQASNALSDGASSQAASIEEIHSSLTEITSSANEVANKAVEAAQIAQKSEEIAHTGADQMEGLSRAMVEIEKASGSIAKIIKTIEDIAFQTNLLALNAAVEAARAGQHGKGFAVVADEVRTLANRSAKAAAETGNLIQLTNEKVENGVAMAKTTELAFDSIRASVADVANRIQIIAETVSSQAKGVAEIGIGLDVINQVTQSNTAHAEESAATSGELAMQSVELHTLVSRFRFDDSEPVVQQRINLPKAKQSTPQPKTVATKRSNSALGWEGTDY